MSVATSTHTVFAPASDAEIRATIQKCRAIATTGAALSATVSVLPIPGLDLLTDVSLLVRTLNKINHEFGLSPDQLAHLQSDKKVRAFNVIVGISGALAGKVVTHRLLTPILKRSGIRLLSRQSARIVPIAGQMVAAAVGFATFRKITNEHIAACAQIAAHILRPDDGVATV